MYISAPHWSSLTDITAHDDDDDRFSTFSKKKNNKLKIVFLNDGYSLLKQALKDIFNIAENLSEK